LASGTAVFLDTTIQIGRFVHAPEMKQRIHHRVSAYDVSVTGLLVRLEFKRRLLREADYLLRLFKRLGSYRRVLRHVTDNLPQQQGRKRTICLEVLETVFDEGDADLTDRARFYLRALLTQGLDEFDRSVDSVLQESGLQCARRGVRELKKYHKYDLGRDKCDAHSEACGIGAFLGDHEKDLRVVLAHLEALSTDEKTDELERAEEFIRLYLSDPEKALRNEPCLRVGDLIIALESTRTPAFYTMNGKESQHLCRALGQELVVRPRYHVHEDRVCPAAAESWPKF